MSVISVIHGLTQLNNPHNLLFKRAKKWTCDGRPQCDVTQSHWLFLPFRYKESPIAFNNRQQLYHGLYNFIHVIKQ